MLEASSDLGASRWTTFRKVTLPMSMPGVIAAFVFVFIPTIGEYVTPQIVGGKGGYLFGNVIQSSFSASFDWQLGSAMSVFMLVAVAILLAIFGRYLNVRTRGRMNPAISTGGRRTLWVVFWFLVVFLYAPIVVLIIFSFNDSEIVSFPWLGFTTKWYHEFLANPALLTALKTSLLVATMTAIVATALAIPAAIALVRRRFFAKGLVSGLMLAPLVIPLVVLGISLLILFNAIGVPLSPFTAAIGHVVIAMPFAILTMVPRLERIPAGARGSLSRPRRLGDEDLPADHVPAAVPALISAFLISFTISFDELVIASFIAGDQATFPVYLYSQLRLPERLPSVIAVAVVILVVSVVVVVASEVGRFLAERRLEAQTGVSRRSRLAAVGEGMNR